MKTFYFNLTYFILAAVLTIGFSTASIAQTTCTQNDPLVCATLTPTTTIFTPVGVSTTVLPVGASTAFTLTSAVLNPAQLSVTSSSQVIAGTGNCVLVSFNAVSTATLTSTDVSILVGTDVITCANVTLTGGTACVRICDPRITPGSTISVRLDFNVSGAIIGSTVTLTAFAVAALNTVPCPTSFVCLTGSDNCTPCDNINFPILSGKIRVFFDQPILAGTPNPIITGAADVTGTLLTRFKFCASADAATNVTRTFVDYCVYTNAAGALLPAITTFGTLQLTLQGNSEPCVISLLPNTCPTIFSFINNTTACSPCDAGFTTLMGKIRLFIPLGAGVPNPIISSVVGLQAALGTVKLCASTDAATNVARTFVDYCIYTNALGATLPLLLNGPITIGIQTSDCIAPTLCVVAADSDGDGIPDNVDVDDDNDGIPDRYEFATGKNGGFTPTNDPSADDDADGIPNYRDPSNPQCGGLNANGVCINYDTDGDGIPNHLDLDSDNDGLPDVIEAGGADANGDGRLDCTGTCDADGDGLLASVDINDGSTATYATSANISKLAIAPNTYVYGGNFYNGVLDTDYDTVPDFLDIDSDNDGIYDIIETGGADANGDGRVDSFADADNDGLSTQYDADVNNDGDVTDTGEGTQKALIISNASNTDGTAESWTDGPNPDKFPVDFDSDILPNYRDLESDSDGINDVLEAGGSDPDGNGIIGTGASNVIAVNADGYYIPLVTSGPLISTDPDATGDGRPNDDADPELSPYFNGGGATPYGGSSTSQLNFRPDQDSDTRPNFLDLDSDNDGINDIIENIGVPATLIDADNDGLIDVALRVDTDFDGIADGGGIDGAVGTFGDAANVPPVNTDADNVPDYLDLDSDNDGLFDVSEGGNPALDANGDGIVDCNVPGSFEACDPDLDGILASVDGQPAVIGDAASPTPPDNDGDGLPDYRDLDSDNNGIFDHTQSGALGPDNNNDGIVDGSDTDFDGIINPDGFPDDNQVFGGNTGLGAPLPVTLVEFKARQNQQNVTVSWITSQEINLSHFEVMRSLDGVNYVSIGTVNATGGLQATNYQFIDNAPAKGNNYYRLRSIDNDANFKYSAIALVKLADKNNILITVSPNPVANQYNVRLAGLEKGAYRIELFNSMGQLQMTKKIIINEFDHVENMQRKSSSGGGLYWLSIVNEKTNSTIKTMRIFMLQE